MKNNNYVRWMLIAMLAAGAITFSLHYTWRNRILPDPQTTLWRFQYELRFRASSPGVKVSLGIPEETPWTRIVRQELYHPGVKLRIVKERQTGAFSLLGTSLNEGGYALRVRYDIRLQANQFAGRRQAQLSSQARETYLHGPEPEADRQIIAATLEKIRSGRKLRKTALLSAIFGYCNTQLAISDDEETRDAATVLETGSGSPAGQVAAMIALCQQAKLPARSVLGFQLKDTPAEHPHYWVEVYQDGGWAPYDPLNGYYGEIPATHLVVRRGASSMVTVGKEAKNLQIRCFAERIQSPGNLPGLTKPGIAVVFDLTRFPLSQRQSIAFLLLMPVGALLTCLARNLIGLRTYGTFSPLLLALSFIYADWRLGTVLLVILLIVGFLSRGVLERLRLLMVPRLSILLTLVVLSMTFAISILAYTGIASSGEAVMLPLVVMTMLIERFHLTEQEDGIVEAVRLLAQTLVLAACCYVVLDWKKLGDLLLAYPELHCATIAALIWVGRYTGYRLSELWRFRDLVQNDNPGEQC